MKPWFHRCCSYGLALLLLACVQQPPPTAPAQPVASPNDERVYRHLVLDNGLQVVLVSDADTEKAAAALDVHVGSAQNPPQRAGLAHFLEHMLFLGTEKYPHPAEYEQFVTEHGGNRNAYTAFEHTNYFFDIDYQHLAPALDRFAQFFIAPNFDADYVAREVNAVEAEYRMGIRTDERRTLDVLREVVNPRHPFSILGVGTRETLADFEQNPVRDALLEWYARYYSAELMGLAVLGREPLAELETMVREKFSAVPRRETVIEDIAEPLFAEGTLPAVVNVQSLSSERQLQLSFPMPDYRDRYRSKSMAYLGNLLGHEGRGSLLSLLKAEGWALALGAGPGLTWRGGSAFSLSMTLTEQGLAHYPQVLDKVFDYIELLRLAGPQRGLYQEQAHLAAQQFRFRESEQALRYVARLANDLHYYRPADVLRGDYLMSDYDAAEIATMLNRYLTPDNVLVAVLSQEAETDRQSEFYATPYSVAAAPADAPWRRRQRPAPDARLQLPAPNPYLATETGLRPRLPAPAAGKNQVPRLVLSEPGLSVWFHQDDEFQVPRGDLQIKFQAPDFSASPRRAALAELYVNLLRDAVTEMTYPALLAGLAVDFYRDLDHLGLRISGYDHKQLLLLEAMVEAVESASFSGSRFVDIKAKLLEQLDSLQFERPYRQVARRAGQLLVHGDWHETELIAELESVELAEVHQYADDFWEAAQAEVLLHGNYDEATVAGVAAVLGELLQPSGPTRTTRQAVVKLPPGQPLLYPVPVDHADSVVLQYYQAAANDWAARAQASMTAQVFKSGFFQQLRTEQQLGYVVSAFYRPYRDVPGVSLLVQSPQASAVAAAQAMDIFVAQSLAAGALSEEQFLRHRRALINEVLAPHRNLAERSAYFWRELGRHSRDFDSRQQLAAALEALDLPTWRAAARELMLQRPARVRVVAPGQWELLPPGEEIDSVAVFQRGTPHYPVP